MSAATGLSSRVPTVGAGAGGFELVVQAVARRAIAATANARLAERPDTVRPGRRGAGFQTIDSAPSHRMSLRASLSSSTRLEPGSAERPVRRAIIASGNNSPMHESAEDSESVVDALITASRALVAVAARSVAELGGDVTLPQYRALVVLASRGPQRGVDLAAELGVTPSTATRLIDRLVKADLVDRQPLPGDRRAVVVTLRTAGRRFVTKVTRRRRAEIRRIVARMSPLERAGAVAGLRALADAAGEVPEQQWWLGFEESEHSERNQEEGEQSS